MLPHIRTPSQAASMSVVINKCQSFFFSSSTENGAENRSADGSRFEVTLNNPLQLPKAAMEATLEVQQASTWNVSPNIAADFKNNVFQFTTSNVASPGVNTLIIPDGLYSLDGLGAYLSTQFTNLGLPSNLITLTGDDATQKTVLTFLEAGDQVDFTVPGSCREILGFNARLAPTVGQQAGWSEFSDNSAAFNRVNSYVIRSNIVSDGLPINNVAAGVIATIPIDQAPGSQINYQPQNPIAIDCRELIGASKLNFSFQLADQLLRPTPTAGELWSFVLTFRWSILLTKERVPLLSV